MLKKMILYKRDFEEQETATFIVSVILLNVGYIQE
jgi:hypothetical protein